MLSNLNGKNEGAIKMGQNTMSVEKKKIKTK